MSSWKESAQTWKGMPLSSSILFFSGVFCLFAALFLMTPRVNLQSQSVLYVFGGALIDGGFAVAWAYAGTRKIIWLFVVVGILQFAAFNALGLAASDHTLATQELATKLRFNLSVGEMLVVTGYILFIFFFNREGARFFRTQTEMRLAGEIHKTLVPQRHERIGELELFGSSAPSGEVGGDLFDIVQSNGSWHAYVADVSGHGVGAGILMSMIKSAASMQLTRLGKPADFLVDLNDIMQSFTSPANYVTLAYLGGEGPENLNFALAGHLPILHYRAQMKNIAEHSDANIPIGLFKNQQFAMSKIALLPRDLLVVITDGFTEVFDREGREMGIDVFRSMLLDWAEAPLPELYQQLRSRTLRFGKQTDDQTMLLIRRLA